MCNISGTTRLTRGFTYTNRKIQKPHRFQNLGTGSIP